ncbi:MAG TPA: hypothetical protein VF988_00690 [Verrucomicrobiae bacterium]
MLTLVTNGGGIVPPSIGPTWDFSQVQQTNEVLLRTDIIAPASGGNSSSFPDAQYAEQDSTEMPSTTAGTAAITNQVGWRYYGMGTAGRTFYGLYAPDTASDGTAVFNPPIVDIPAAVTNGQSWSLATSWNTVIQSIYPVTYQLSVTATVDAQGTMILPNLNSMQALRVHETHGYLAYLWGSLVENVTNEYYYWLVPGIGVVAQIGIYGNDVVGGGTPSCTNSVQRMFNASYYSAPSPSPYVSGPVNLRAQMSAGAVALDWDRFTNPVSHLASTGYVVQACSSLHDTNWYSLGLTSTTNWTDATGATQRFYRVVGYP